MNEGREIAYCLDEISDEQYEANQRLVELAKRVGARSWEDGERAPITACTLTVAVAYGRTVCIDWVDLHMKILDAAAS